jgi:RNA polymerase sigma-70 factor (ECF subfamily)
MDLGLILWDLQAVLSLNPIFVELQGSATQSLIERARSGDLDAFGEVCRLHESRLLRQGMRLSGNPTVAEELAQDTLVEAWRCLSRYHGKCQFFTWLCAIMLNRFRNLRRHESAGAICLRNGATKGMADLFENLVALEEAPDEAAEARDQAAVVMQCINSLPPKQQQVIYLRFYIDESLDGIGAALNCSVGTVKSRLFNALEKLRAMPALRQHSKTAHSDLKISAL